ncbi:MAG: putative quinol monooxygenase [Magnetovibrio sp.]|nr:putative quinol monooxygenase [Magnetovibrio sp.]
MTRFAIVVTLKLKPGSAEAFKPIILENATAAVRDEAECHQFHVLQSNDDPDTIMFYEVYTSAASLDAHREEPHYKKYVELAGDMIAERDIRMVTVLNPGNVADTLGAG